MGFIGNNGVLFGRNRLKLIYELTNLKVIFITIRKQQSLKKLAN